MNKKGQLKIQQMAFLLMAITIFFVLAGLFALGISASNSKKGAEAIREQNAVTLVSRIANSPEFSCGRSFGGDKLDCIDLDKVMVLSKNSERYKSFWGIDNIEIRIVSEEPEKICTSQNYPQCNTIKIINKETKGVPVSSFVSLCRKKSFERESNDHCEIARISISYNLRW